MQSIKTFNPRLIKAEHFEKLKNQIDVNTETLFDKERQLDEKLKNEINSMRDEQIKKLEEIEQKNLSRWPLTFEKESFEHEWSHLLDDDAMMYEEKIEKIKEKIFVGDCLLIDNDKLGTKVSLWIVPYFVNTIDLKFARYFFFVLKL